MRFKEIVDQIPLLSEAERKQLMLVLESFAETKQYDLLDFVGFAAELYNGTDAQDYVNRLRDDWDKRE